MQARMVIAGAALALLVVTTRAHADDASDAKDLFARARQLRAAGDCAGALPLFHKAFDVYPSALGSLRNAAECEESTGRWASARRSWLDLKRAVMLTSDAKYHGWDADADAAAQRLAPRVSHLTVDVSTSAGTKDGALEVTINGESLPNTLLGTTLDRDPGKYVVRARVAGGEPAEQTVDLVTGESRTAQLVVAAPKTFATEHVATPPVVTVAPPPKRSSSTWPIVGAVSASLGGVALVSMGVAIGVRQDALSTLDAQCPSHTNCPPSVKPAVDRGNAASTAATALAVGGGALAAAGIVVLVIGAVSRPPREHVAFFASPMGVSLEGRF